MCAQMVACWREVSNAGGPVGFPFLPVDEQQVLPAVEDMVGSLDPALSRLLVATVDQALAGCAHWLHHRQRMGAGCRPRARLAGQLTTSDDRAGPLRWPVDDRPGGVGVGGGIGSTRLRSAERSICDTLGGAELLRRGEYVPLWVDGLVLAQLELNGGIDHRGVHTLDDFGIHVFFNRSLAQSAHHLGAAVGSVDSRFITLVRRGLLDLLLAACEERHDLVVELVDLRSNLSQ